MSENTVSRLLGGENVSVDAVVFPVKIQYNENISIIDRRLKISFIIFHL